MKFEETFDFDHDAPTVLRMFTDVDFYRRKYEKLYGKQTEIVDSAQTGSGFSITARHRLDADKLSFPEILKKRMGDGVMLRQTDTWEAATATGRIDIDIEKLPVTVRIGLRLAERGSDSSRLHLDFDIDARVPLLGSKIENAIAGPITRRMRTDLQASNNMAADYARQ